MVIKLKSIDEIRHTRVWVYVGPDADHLALSGTLAFDVSQWQSISLVIDYIQRAIGRLADFSIIQERL